MNDLQNAYALSVSEYRNNGQTRQIEQLVIEGKSVVYVVGLIHCKFTDAVIASEDHIIAVFDYADQAQDYFDANVDKYCGELEIRRADTADPDPEIANPLIDEEECPF
jgi:hypothetical protein